MTQQTPFKSLSNRERLRGRLRFLAFLIGLIMTVHTIAQVVKHWEPGGDNFFFYAISSFANYFWPRLLLGAAIGVVFLTIAMIFKLRPPWSEASDAS